MARGARAAEAGAAAVTVRSLPPRGAVSLAGVVDLERAFALRLGDGIVESFLGGTPTQVPERYELASPAALLPLGVKQVLVHGARDDVVPPEQSRDYAAAARAAGRRGRSRRASPKPTTST